MNNLTKFEVKGLRRSYVMVRRNIEFLPIEFLTLTHILLQYHEMLPSKGVC